MDLRKCLHTVFGKFPFTNMRTSKSCKSISQTKTSFNNDSYGRKSVMRGQYNTVTDKGIQNRDNILKKYRENMHFVTYKDARRVYLSNYKLIKKIINDKLHKFGTYSTSSTRNTSVSRFFTNQTSLNKISKNIRNSIIKNDNSAKNIRMNNYCINTQSNKVLHKTRNLHYVKIESIMNKWNKEEPKFYKFPSEKKLKADNNSDSINWAIKKYLIDITRSDWKNIRGISSKRMRNAKIHYLILNW